MSPEETEMYNEFKKLKKYKPRHYAKCVAERIPNYGYELQRIYNVASGIYFNSEIMSHLLDVFNEEKIRRENIKKKIKKINEADKPT